MILVGGFFTIIGQVLWQVLGWKPILLQFFSAYMRIFTCLVILSRSKPTTFSYAMIFILTQECEFTLNYKEE